MSEMFVIRSKKTGKTFLRLRDIHGGFDWVQFREEEPTQFAKEKAEALNAKCGVLGEVVLVTEVPTADSGEPLDEVLRKRRPLPRGKADADPETTDPTENQRKRYAREGGAAFPLSTDEFFQRGMTLRDWFAGQALAGILAAQADPRTEVLIPANEGAKEAYDYADAMLAARKAATEKATADRFTKDDEHFREWMAAVDRELVKRTGIDSGSLPAIDYRALYEDEQDPGEAADEAIRNAKES